TRHCRNHGSARFRGPAGRGAPLKKRGEPMSLAGRVALITGGARGIGLAIARRLVADGARVALVDLDKSAVEAAASESGASAGALVADVTRTDDVERAVGAAQIGRASCRARG